MWTNEAKFVANAYGLRNRMTILAETPGHESFERRIYAHYSLITGVLEYANAHGKEMQEVCRAADGFVGWGVFDPYFESAGADTRSVVYPVYKYFKILE